MEKWNYFSKCRTFLITSQFREYQMGTWADAFFVSHFFSRRISFIICADESMYIFIIFSQKRRIVSKQRWTTITQFQLKFELKNQTMPVISHWKTYELHKKNIKLNGSIGLSGRVTKERKWNSWISMNSPRMENLKGIWNIHGKQNALFCVPG